MSTIVATNLQAAGGAGTAATLASINGDNIAGNRNRIINGSMMIDQRNAGASQTITAAAALAYTVDRWYAYCTGANVTGQRVQGASAGMFRYQFTGAASVTGIGFGQRIEQINSAALAGTTATLSVDLANSVLTTVTWTAYYANTADAFGTLASPTRTQIATGTWTVNSTVTRYSTNISIPAAATTGIEIVLSVGAQTSGTWTIGAVQLEPGSVATPFERRGYGLELMLAQRYFESSFADGIAPGTINTAVVNTGQWALYGAYAGNFAFSYKVRKRAAPTVTVYAPLDATSVGRVRRADNGTINTVSGASATADAAAMTIDSGTASALYQFGYTASAEL